MCTKILKTVCPRFMLDCVESAFVGGACCLYTNQRYSIPQQHSFSCIRCRDALVACGALRFDYRGRCVSFSIVCGRSVYFKSKRIRLTPIEHISSTPLPIGIFNSLRDIRDYSTRISYQILHQFFYRKFTCLKIRTYRNKSRKLLLLKNSVGNDLNKRSLKLEGIYTALIRPDFPLQVLNVFQIDLCIGDTRCFAHLCRISSCTEA